MSDNESRIITASAKRWLKNKAQFEKKSFNDQTDTIIFGSVILTFILHYVLNR